MPDLPNDQDVECVYYWITLRVREYGSGEPPRDCLESHAVDALPFTWFRAYRRCQDKQARVRRKRQHMPEFSYYVAPNYELDDFRQISKEEYEDAARNEMASSMASLEAWYHRIGEPAEDVKQGPYR